MTDAAAWPRTTATRLNAPKPAPRRLAGMASDRPARSAGTASAMTNAPIVSRTNAAHSGTKRYDAANTTCPSMMQYAGIAMRAPRMRVAYRSATRPPSSTPGMQPSMINAPT